MSGTELSAGPTKAAQDRIATLALSLFAIHGYPAPGSDALGSIVHSAMAGVSHDEMRDPASLSTSAISRIDQLVMNSVEAGKPRNAYGADAARAAQAAGGAHGHRHGSGFDFADGRPGSSARFREISSDGSAKSGSSQSSSASGGTGGPVTAEFARSFAGTGVVGGNLRTFSEVGLDRGTFNEFRKEGFSKEQIVDNAKDTKAMGWKGKEDLSIGQHALPEARKAAIAVEQAKTPEALAKAQEHEAAVAKKVEALPDSDPRKHGTKRYFNHVIEKSKKAERHKALGTSAVRDDVEASKDHVGKSASADKIVQDQQSKKFAKTSVAALNAGDKDDWGSTAASTPTPAKPAPSKNAVAKPTGPTSSPA